MSCNNAVYVVKRVSTTRCAIGVTVRSLASMLGVHIIRETKIKSDILRGAIVRAGWRQSPHPLCCMITGIL